MKFRYMAVGACWAGLAFAVMTAKGAEENMTHESGLLCSVFVAKPTEHSVTMSIVNGEKPFTGQLCTREEGSGDWNCLPLTMGVTSQENPKGGTRLVQIGNLKAATRYRFEVRDTNGKNVSNGEGSFVTQRAGTVPFRFLAMTDAHVNPLNPERNIVLRTCADAAARLRPDFVFHMGDNIQTVASSHGGPAVQEEHPSIFYLYWRQVMGKLQGETANFVLNGNWEGENGWHPELNRKWARDARMLFAPAPDGATYPQGGSPHEDYYAFTWGNALFVTLNATGYNVINHEHTLGPGRGDDWTLGKEQYAWLEKTLRESGEPWKFLFIHHAVGGNAGDDVNTRYGRGGGRAAHVGEQAQIHEMMKKYGVQVFFYAHDHVFTDMEVDGIHYICNGSVGAPWKFGTEETGYEFYIPDSGFTVVDVNGDKARIRYVRPDEREADVKTLYTLDLSLQ